MRINEPNESASPKTRSERDSILTLILGIAENSDPSLKHCPFDWRLWRLDLTSQLAPPALPLLKEFLFLFARQETSSLRSLRIRNMITMRMAAFIIMILVLGRVFRRGERDENRMEIRCGLTSTV